ncbi:MAG: ABC transporter permease, partial [Martelella sp.]
MTMQDQINTADTPTDTAGAARPANERSAFQRILTLTVGPIIAAFLLSAIILVLVGVNPLTYYGYIL